MNGDARPDFYAAAYDAGFGECYTNNSPFFGRVMTGSIRLDFGTRSAAAIADFDNDGNRDVFAVGASGDRNALYRGLGGSSFESVASAVTTPASVGMSAIWGDLDLDGLVDLFVVNGGGGKAEQNFLYRNKKAEGLVRVTEGIIATEVKPSHGAAMADYDGDGDLDILVTHAGTEAESFFRNDGAWRFTPILNGEIGISSGSAGGSLPVWGDYDNDGDLDLLIVTGRTPNRLYQNEPGGVLVRVMSNPVAASGGQSAGGVWADFDNDGWLDLILTRRTGRHLMFRGIGDGNFEAVTEGLIPNESQGSNGIAVADYDGDGDVDIYLSNWPGTGAPALYRNETTGNRWLRVRLVGTASNRAGIGAKVRVTANIRGRQMQQLRQVGGFDAAGSHELVAHFGMGDANLAESVRIEWPSGIVQELPRISTGQTFVAIEPVAIPALVFLPGPGLFTNFVDVAMKVGIQNAEIRFTADGTEPTSQSPLYREPIHLTVATTLRARAFANAAPVTDPIAGTYTRVYAFDDDGIPASWRIQYFGPDYATDPRAAADADPDRDGSTNRQEYATGTDPLNALSGFSVGVRAVPEIRFGSLPGKKYRVLRFESVTGSESVVVAEILASANETTWVDTEAGVVVNPAFYVVQPVP